MDEIRAKHQGIDYTLKVFGPYDDREGGQSHDIEIYAEDVYVDTYSLPVGLDVLESFQGIASTLPGPEDMVDFEPVFDPFDDYYDR